MNAKISSGSVIVHQYRYFYYLANELAHRALNETHDINAFRYSIGTVIMSYTTIEVYFNHIMNSDVSPIFSFFEGTGMNRELSQSIERLSLPNKIEFVLRFYPNARPDFLKTDTEPYQSFNLLREARNFLVHYQPEEEMVWSESGKHLHDVKKLEKKLTGKFSFPPFSDVQEGDFTKAFVYRVFNRNCAKWAFESVAPFIESLAVALQIGPKTLKVNWQLE